MFVFTHTMPGEGGVLEGVLLALDAGAAPLAPAGLLAPAAGAGGVLGVVLGFAALVVGVVAPLLLAGLLLLVAVLLELLDDELPLADEELPLDGFELFALLFFDDLLVVLELLDDVPVVEELCALNPEGVTMPKIRAPKMRAVIGFFIRCFIRSPSYRPVWAVGLPEDIASRIGIKTDVPGSHPLRHPVRLSSEKT